MTRDVLITDGGLETTLIFHDGVELPEFAAFPLLDRSDGRAALKRYFAPYFHIAREHGARFQLDTATWRASRDWGERLGYDRAALDRLNRDAVVFARELAAGNPDVEVRVNGVVGPRGDGYLAAERMQPDEAQRYHADQIASFAAAGADLISAITMTYPDEAIGIVRAATDAVLPVIVSLTLETDGRLPDQTTLGNAIALVDAATDDAAEAFMINCAHPTHFESALQEDAGWRRRIHGLRANSSRLSHAELDEAQELDAGDPADLAARYVELRERLPELTILGGCCGTDARHIAAIAAAWHRKPIGRVNASARTTGSGTG
jgi:S-methylmethionine-dependent homocysteine/selenocysteine methylase